MTYCSKYPAISRKVVIVISTVIYLDHSQHCQVVNLTQESACINTGIPRIVEVTHLVFTRKVIYKRIYDAVAVTVKLREINTLRDIILRGFKDKFEFTIIIIRALMLGGVPVKYLAA